MDKIYKRMMDESPIAYFCIKALKNEFDEYIGIEIIDANKSFESMFDTKLKHLINKEIDGELIEEEAINWKEILEKASKTDKYIVKKYIKSSNLYLSVEIYNVSNEKFAIRLIEVNQEYMNLSSIFKNSAYRSWIKDRSGKYIDVNNVFLDAVNMLHDEVIGKTDIEIFGQEKGEEFAKEDKKVMKGNELFTRQQKEEIGEDKVDYFQVAKWGYTDKHNNVLGTIGIAIDITDKVKLKQNIKRNEENFIQIAKYSSRTLRK